MTRITPLSEPYSDDLKQRFAQIVPAGFKPPRIYRTFARNESLLVNLVDTGVLGLTGLFDRGVLASPLRELLILRTCVAAGNDYEWHMHVDTGLSAHMGLTDNQIADTRNPAPDEALWSSSELAAISLVDALVDRLSVDDDLFDRLRQHYDESTLIEITQLIGWYTIVAMQVALAALRPNDRTPKAFTTS